MSDENAIYILDAYGLIYRSYFAFISRPMINSKEENVSAILGFFKNLHSLIVKHKPKYIVAAFDSKGKTFRHKMYSEYKATRNKTPDDLHSQIPIIEEILQALGIPVLLAEGFEADDVIATVASLAKKAGKTCKILSGDKDLMQLVSDTTFILKPDVGGVWKIVDKNGVQAEWGVPPEKMLDLLALIGDTADNVPGVKGVGPKTACKFLDEYGTLEEIFNHTDEIKGAIGVKLREGKESAFFSKKLIALCENIDGLNDLEKIVPEVKFNFEKASKILKVHEVNSVAKSFLELSHSKDFQNGANNANASSSSSNISSESAKGEPNGKMSFLQEEDSTPIAQNKGSYKALKTLQELTSFIDDVLSQKKCTVAFDTETDGLNTHNANIVGFSLSCKKGSGVYVPLILGNELFSESTIEKSLAISQLKRLFLSESITLVMHNGKFDYEILRSNGLSFEQSGTCDTGGQSDTGEKSGTGDTGGQGEKIRCTIADTMVASWLLDPDKILTTSYALEYLAEKKLHLKGIEFNTIVPKGGVFSDVPLEIATSYAAEDADFTLQLWDVLKSELEKNDLLKLFFEIEMPLLPLLSEMEIKGIHIDKSLLNEYNKELKIEIASLQKEIFSLIGHEFNIASPKQLQEVLFEELKLPHGKKTKTGYSTDTSVLEEIASFHPAIEKIITFREKTKLNSTYVESLPKLSDKNDRVHTSYLQVGTSTGRLSSRDPNLQNIPIKTEEGRRIRSAFTSKQGYKLISADYSQIELVVLAHLSGDPIMKKAFISGNDIHKETASRLFGVALEKVTAEERRIAKSINFGIIYGMSAFRLAKDLNLSRTQANEFIENYFLQYKDVKKFIDECIYIAETTGYAKTIFGRKRRILNINSKNKVEKMAAERMAVNTPVQGSAADIVKKAMLNVDQKFFQTQLGVNLLLQVHDELIFECPEKNVSTAITLIKNEMENALPLSVPLRVSIESGNNWGEFH